MLLPSIVFPIHDLNGQILNHVINIMPLLKQHFSNAIVGVTESTFDKYPNQVDRIAQGTFCKPLITPRKAPVGKQIKLLYQNAVTLSHPKQILHLCYPDRLAFALQDRYRKQFLSDIKAIKPDQTPLIFQRSQKAWESHPRNYFEIEGMLATVSQRLLGKIIDFAWCHLAIQSSQLVEILPGLNRDNISVVAQVIVPIIDLVKSQEVDWLAWEDPFICSCDAEALKTARENSIPETQKRLAYVIPMIQMISDAANKS